MEGRESKDQTLEKKNRGNILPLFQREQEEFPQSFLEKIEKQFHDWREKVKEFQQKKELAQDLANTAFFKETLWPILKEALEKKFSGQRWKGEKILQSLQPEKITIVVFSPQEKAKSNISLLFTPKDKNKTEQTIRVKIFLSEKDFGNFEKAYRGEQIFEPIDDQMNIIHLLSAKKYEIWHKDPDSKEPRTLFSLLSACQPQHIEIWNGLKNLTPPAEKEK